MSISRLAMLVLPAAPIVVGGDSEDGEIASVQPMTNTERGEGNQPTIYSIASVTGIDLSRGSVEFSGYHMDAAVVTERSYRV